MNFFRKIGKERTQAGQKFVFPEKIPFMKEFSIPKEQKRKYKKIPKPIFSRFESKMLNLCDKVMSWVIDEDDVFVIPSDLLDINEAKNFIKKNEGVHMHQVLYDFGMDGTEILAKAYSEIRTLDDFDRINEVNEKGLQALLKLFGNVFYFFNDYKKKTLSPFKSTFAQIDSCEAQIENIIKDLKYVRKTTVQKQKIEKIHELSKKMEDLQNDVHSKTKDFKRHSLILGTNISLLSIQVGSYDDCIEFRINELLKKTVPVGVKLTEEQKAADERSKEILPKLYAKRISEFGVRYGRDTVEALREFVNFSKKKEYKSIEGIDEVLKVIKELCEDKSEKMKDIVDLCTSADYKVYEEYTMEFHQDIRYVIDIVYTAIRANVIDRVLESKIKNHDKVIYDESEMDRLERKYYNDFNTSFITLTKLVGFYDEIFHAEKIVSEEADKLVENILRDIEKTETETEIEKEQKSIDSILYGDKPTTTGGVVMAAIVELFVSITLAWQDLQNTIESNKKGFMASIKEYFWPESEEGREKQGYMSWIVGGTISAPARLASWVVEQQVWFLSSFIGVIRSVFNWPAKFVNLILSVFAVWNVPLLIRMFGMTNMAMKEMEKEVLKKGEKVIGISDIFGKWWMYVFYTIGAFVAASVSATSPAIVPAILSMAFAGLAMRLLKALTQRVHIIFNFCMNRILKWSGSDKKNIFSLDAAATVWFIVLNTLYDSIFHYFGDESLLAGGFSQIMFFMSPMYLYTMWMYISFENFFDKNRKFIMNIIRKLLRKKKKFDKRIKEDAVVWVVYVLIRNGSLMMLNFLVPKTRHPLLYDKNKFYFTPDPDLHKDVDSTGDGHMIEISEEKVEKSFREKLYDLKEKAKELPEKLKEKAKEIPGKLKEAKDYTVNKIKDIKDYAMKEGKYSSRANEEKEEIETAAKQSGSYLAGFFRSMFTRRKNDRKYFVGLYAGIKQPIKSALFRLIRQKGGFDFFGSVVRYQVGSALFEYSSLFVDNLVDIGPSILFDAPTDDDAIELANPNVTERTRTSLEVVSSRVTQSVTNILVIPIINVPRNRMPNSQQIMNTVRGALQRGTEGLKSIKMEDKIQSKINESISQTGIPCSLVDICNFIDSEECFKDKEQKKEEVKKNWDKLTENFYK